MSLGGIYIQKRSPAGSNINVTSLVQNWQFYDSNLVTLCNVGIGTQTPGAKLSVLGNMVVTDLISTAGLSILPDLVNSASNVVISGGNMAPSATSSGSLWTSASNSNSIYVYSNVGIFTSNPSYNLHVVGTIYATQDVIMTSDSNLKTDIQPLSNTLNKLENLQGYTFTMKQDPQQRRQLVLIAQEVNTVFPELVHKDATTDTLGLSYANMAGVFVSAINELTQRVKVLEDILAQK